MSKQLTGQTEPRLLKFYTAFYFRKFYIPYNEPLDPSKGEIMDNIETTKTDEISLGKSLVKDFAGSLASSAGLLGGLVLVALAVEQFRKVTGRRKDKKNRLES